MVLRGSSHTLTGVSQRVDYMVMLVTQHRQRLARQVVQLVAVVHQLIYRVRAAGMHHNVKRLQELNALFQASRALDRRRYARESMLLHVADGFGPCRVSGDKPLLGIRHGTEQVRQAVNLTMNRPGFRGGHLV